MSKKNNYIDHLKSIIEVLPDSPGVYQYFNENGKIIYVGKAKNLKRRVTSYFVKTHDNRKTEILVQQIADIKYIVVETEEDALLLENNLIKKYQPKYNVLLKDDKTYPWICVKSEPFPRVFQTRNIIKDGSSYFGPYTSSLLVRSLLELIHSLYKIRTCNFNLTPENIRSFKFKVCLEYHIGNCLGPCEGLQTEEDYLNSIQEIKSILKGNLQNVIRYLKESMNTMAAEYRFEEAQFFKNKIEILEKFKSKSTVVNSQISNVDVFSVDLDEKYGYVNFLRIVDGAIIQVFTQEIKRRLEESPEELLVIGITEIKQKIFSSSR
ncbi:MAG: excinuclease ABC subunit UvrC [Bacteroidota bacterium]|nr:excinuclease ABC subunit UvrC [Bacteroidota bacterium]